MKTILRIAWGLLPALFSPAMGFELPPLGKETILSPTETYRLLLDENEMQILQRSLRQEPTKEDREKALQFWDKLLGKGGIYPASSDMMLLLYRKYNEQSTLEDYRILALGALYLRVLGIPPFQPEMLPHASPAPQAGARHWDYLNPHVKNPAPRHPEQAPALEQGTPEAGSADSEPTDSAHKKKKKREKSSRAQEEALQMPNKTLQGMLRASLRLLLLNAEDDTMRDSYVHTKWKPQDLAQNDNDYVKLFSILYPELWGLSDLPDDWEQQAEKLVREGNNLNPPLRYRKMLQKVMNPYTSKHVNEFLHYSMTTFEKELGFVMQPEPVRIPGTMNYINKTMAECFAEISSDFHAERKMSTLLFLLRNGAFFPGGTLEKLSKSDPELFILTLPYTNHSNMHPREAWNILRQLLRELDTVSPEERQGKFEQICNFVKLSQLNINRIVTDITRDNPYWSMILFSNHLTDDECVTLLHTFHACHNIVPGSKHAPALHYAREKKKEKFAKALDALGIE